MVMQIRALSPARNVDIKTATKVDEYGFEHLHINSPSALPSVEILNKAYDNQVGGGLPPVAVTRAQGTYIQVQAKIANAKNILEVGTLAGYSTLFLVHTSPETKVTTIEYNPAHSKIARANFEMAGVTDRITLHEGSAVDIVPTIYEEIKAGRQPEFDFVFIDADKPSNWFYFDLAIKSSRKGAVIIVDNVVWRGRLVDPAFFHESFVAGCRDVVERAGADPRVYCSLIQTVGDGTYDGMMVCVKL